MSDLTERRAEFGVLVVDRDATQATTLTQALKASGYTVHFSPTVDAALARLHELSPHIVVFNYANEENEGDDFLENVKELSPEIRVLVLCENRHRLQLLQFVKESGNWDYLCLPLVSDLEVVHKLDTFTTEIFLCFENQDLREQSNLPVERKTSFAAEVQSDASIEQISPKYDLNNDLAELAEIKDVSQLLQGYVDLTGRLAKQSPVLYFRLHPKSQALVITNCAWMPQERIRGIGLKLTDQECLQVQGNQADPTCFLPLQKLLQEAFYTTRFLAWNHCCRGEVRGVIVLLATEKALVPQALTLQLFFELLYERNEMIRDLHQLQVRDSKTGLLKANQFTETVEAELARARRIQMPVTLLKIRLDLRSSSGAILDNDNSIRRFAAVLKNTTRKSDVLFHIANDEMALLLPHTSANGGAVKAERLRRSILANAERNLGVQKDAVCRIAIGLSEYPAHSSDAIELVRLADMALTQAMGQLDAGVCMAAPVDAFEPDFTPSIAPNNTPENKTETSLIGF